jgi:hypothetical protein
VGSVILSSWLPGCETVLKLCCSDPVRLILLFEEVICIYQEGLTLI